MISVPSEYWSVREQFPTDGKMNIVLPKKTGKIAFAITWRKKEFPMRVFCLTEAGFLNRADMPKD